MTWTNIPDKSTGDLMDETWYDTHFKANMEHLETRMPQRATMWHCDATIVAGNAFTESASSSQYHSSLVRQSAAANGDTFTQSVFLKAGTYTLYILGYASATHGKIDWYIDDVLIASGQDWYASTGTYNVLKTVSSITLSESGYHVLKGVINGKNGSSSDYGMWLTKYWLKPSSD